jgi:tetratricopeptide (TPR) repeat protein
LLDHRFAATTLMNLGTVHHALGSFDAARNDYIRALQIHRELGNRRSEGITLSNLGDLCSELEQSPQARSYYEQAIDVATQTGAAKPLGLSLVSLASLHLQCGEYEEASARFLEALDIFEEVPVPIQECVALGGLGAATAMTGDCDKAEEYLVTAHNKALSATDPRIGDALDLFRAHVELARAVQSSSPSQAKVLRNRVLKRIADVEREENGQPSKALRSENVRAALRSIKGALLDHPEE